MPLYVCNGEKVVETFALLDGGANRHVVSKDICRKLNLHGKTMNMRITTLDKTVEGEREIADVTVKGTNGYTLTLNNAIFGDIIASKDDRPPRAEDVEGMEHLADIEFPTFPEESEEEKIIGVIIGAEQARIWMGGERRLGAEGLPMGLSTSLGFGLIGPRNHTDSRYFVCNFASFHSIDSDLTKTIRRMNAGEFEKINENEREMSLEDKYAIRQMKEGIHWDPETGHYRCPPLYKKGREETARVLNNLDSDAMAIDRLYRLKRTLSRDPERRRITFETMAKFEEKGRVVKVDPNEHANMPPDRPKWTIPIHVTDKPGKPGQVRICHDCKASVRGTSLNDCLLEGPQLACDIRGVLMRFRDGGPVAVGADIKDYFHEIYITEEDAGIFRYYWFKDEKMEEIDLNGFLGHVFGAKPSNCVSIFTLRHHVEQHSAEYGPLVVQAVMRNMYVDDLIKSLRSTPIAKEFRIGITAALQDAGMNLCKWRSNKPEVLEGDQTDPAPAALKDVSGATNDVSKLLGMFYSFSHDVFSYSPDKAKTEMKVETKRQMLQVIASVFDPLGFMEPFVIWARLILQKVLRRVESWDSKDVPTEYLAEFTEWHAGFARLMEFRISRWTATLETMDGKVTLHGFSDSSGRAYGAVYYVRRESEDGHIHVAIVCAKSHVVPLKDVEACHMDSTPRLELQAARLSARMRATIEQETGGFDEIVMWTDSECVIKQLNDTETRFKVYFANRLSEIQALTKVAEWRWVPTHLNPADDASKGMLAHDPKWGRFHNGPDFLWQREEEWPAKQVVTRPFPAHILATSAEPKPAPSAPWALRVSEKVATWRGKLRRVALFKRVIMTCVVRQRRRALLSNAGYLAAPSNAELNDAERLIVSSIQNQSFHTEMESLRRCDAENLQKVAAKSPLAALCPFIDDAGILRCRGRLQNAEDLDYDAKNPMILPHGVEAVDSLIRSFHFRYLHAGVEQVLGESRRRFWILKGRRTVSRVVRACTECQRQFKNPAKQLMAPLPEVRTRMCLAFENSGVDIFGPARCKIAGRAFHKVYVALFTCMATRAVHFEVLRSMSASCFIDALIRFQARRPAIRHLFSDNGSNFTAADKELRAEMDAWNLSAQPEMRLTGVQWTFNPPVAPHRGGVWERLVQSAKRHLTFVLQQDNLHIETFATVLAQAEMAMNSRPITHVGDEPGIHALRPLDFLCPGVYASSGCDIVPPTPPDVEALRYTWRQSRALADSFWKRWRRDYISALQARPKWRRIEEDLKVDDVVLLVDEQCRRGDWRTGVITEVDGCDVVRTVKVKIATGKIFERDRTKVVRLELDPMRVSA